MESAQQAVRDGNLDEALRLVQQEVRSNPAAGASRIFLFQLLTVMGDWKRALTQLDVLHDLDAKTLAMVGTYRQVIQCELIRQDVFVQGRTPLIFGDPEPWIAWMVEAMRLDAAGHRAECRALREKAFAEAPAIAGSVDDVAFAWIGDADSRLGPILEVITNGRFYWVPFHRIQAIEIMPPTDLRDLVWAPVLLTWTNGGQVYGFIPTRYAGSESAADPAIRMARRTEWIQVENGVFHGLGQRVLATDQADYPLLECRNIRLGHGAG